MPSYELHRTLEAQYEEGLLGRSSKAIYKYMWAGRYVSVEYSEDSVRNTRTVVVVEDLGKEPEAVSLCGRIRARRRRVVGDMAAVAVVGGAARTVDARSPPPRVRDPLAVLDDVPPPPYGYV